jgi:hypothetical protein
MLDGASAFLPVPVPVSSYIDQLGKALREALDDEHADLQTALASAIAETAAELRLSPGQSPSSSVTSVRERRDDISILVLGDNLVVLPNMQISDDRLSNIAPDIRAAYRARLASGAGCGPDHQRLLTELQQQQALQRNTDGGSGSHRNLLQRRPRERRLSPCQTPTSRFSHWMRHTERRSTS